MLSAYTCLPAFLLPHNITHSWAMSCDAERVRKLLDIMKTISQSSAKSRAYIQLSGEIATLFKKKRDFERCCVEAGRSFPDEAQEVAQILNASTDKRPTTLHSRDSAPLTFIKWADLFRERAQGRIRAQNHRDRAPTSSVPGPPRGIGTNKTIGIAVQAHFSAARRLAFSSFTDCARGRTALPSIDEADARIPELDAMLGMDDFGLGIVPAPETQRPASAPPIMAPVTPGMLPSFSPRSVLNPL